MNTEELLAIANKLEAAYRAEDNLKANTETLAKEARRFIREAIVNYFTTQEMLLAICNKVKLRDCTHYTDTSFFSRGRGVVGLNLPYVAFSHKDLYMYVGFTGKTEPFRWPEGGVYDKYCVPTEDTKYIAIRITMQRGSTNKGLLDCDWFLPMDGKATIRFFDTHVWQAEGYVHLKDSAARLNEITELMKSAFSTYADNLIEEVKKTTADLIA